MKVFFHAWRKNTTSTNKKERTWINCVALPSRSAGTVFLVFPGEVTGDCVLQLQPPTDSRLV